MEFPRIERLLKTFTAKQIKTIKLRYKDLENYPEENTSEQHFEAFLKILEKMKESSDNIPISIDMLLDLFQITPLCTEQTLGNFTPEVISSFIQTITTDEQTHKCILAFIYYLLPQDLDVQVKLANIIISQKPSLKQTHFSLFESLGMLYDESITDDKYKELFLSCKKTIDSIQTTIKETTSIPHLILLAKISGTLINSLSKRNMDNLTFATTEIAKIICTNPFPLLFLNIEPNRIYELVDLPPLSVLASAPINITPNIISSYKSIFMILMSAIIAAKEINRQIGDPDAAFSDVYKAFSLLPCGNAPCDALAIILRHFIRSSALYSYFIEMIHIINGQKNTKNATEHDKEGIRQLYMCLFVLGFNEHATPAGIAFCFEYRELLIKITQDIAEAIPVNPFRQKVISLRNALTRNIQMDKPLTQQSFSIILSSDHPKIEALIPATLDQYVCTLQKASAIEPFFELAYTYTRQIENTKLQSYQSLDILSALEQISYNCEPWNNRNAWKTLIRSRIVAETPPLNIFLCAQDLNNLSPTRFVGLLSYLAEIFYKNDQFDQYITVDPNFLPSVIDRALTSELPACTYLLPEILENFPHSDTTIPPILNLYKLPSDENPLRKQMRLIGVTTCSPRFIKSSNILDTLSSLTEKIVETNPEVKKMKVYIQILRVIAENDEKQTETLSQQIIEEISQTNEFYAYCSLVSICLTLGKAPFSSSDFENVKDYGNKDQFLQFLELFDGKQNTEEFALLQKHFYWDWYSISNDKSWVRELTCSCYIQE